MGLYPPIYAPPPPYAPSAPPLPPQQNVQNPANTQSNNAFAITCIALGIFAIIAGAAVDSAFLFGMGFISLIVGLASAPSSHKIHFSLSPLPLYLPSFWSTPRYHPIINQSPSLPIFVNQTPTHHQPTIVPLAPNTFQGPSNVPPGTRIPVGRF